MSLEELIKELQKYSGIGLDHLPVKFKDIYGQEVSIDYVDIDTRRNPSKIIIS